MNLRSKSRTNVSSGEVANVHQVHHVDKPGSSANGVRKHRDILYAHRERHQYYKSKRLCTKAVGEAETSIRNGVGKKKGEGERKEKAIQAKAERIETPKSKYP